MPAMTGWLMKGMFARLDVKLTVYQALQLLFFTLSYSLAKKGDDVNHSQNPKTCKISDFLAKGTSFRANDDF
jgi:hypothetical protein